MTILGGIAGVIGPAVGAAIFLALEVTVRAHTEHWPILLGSILVFLVMVLPHGVAGTVRQRVHQGDSIDSASP